MLEHLMLTPEIEAMAEAAECRLNGTTYREFVTLTVEGPAHRWREGISSLLQALEFNPTEARLAVERRVILEEIRLQDRRTLESVERDIWRSFFPDASPWAQRTSGEESAISTLTVERIKESFSHSFTRANLVFAVAGAVKESDVMAVATKALESLPAGEKLSAAAYAPQGRQKALIRGNLAGQGFAAPGIRDMEAYAAFAIAFSCLTESVRGRLKLDAFDEWFGPSEHGSIASFALRFRSGASAGDAIDHAIRSLPSSAGPSIGRTRRMLISSVEIAKNDPRTCSLHMGSGALCNRPDLLDDYARALADLSEEAVLRAAASIAAGVGQ
jgi:predicted Zn-dependent peptidase